MISEIMFCFCAVFLLLPIVHSACDSTPISLPIGNVSITNDPAVVRWGLGLRFGTPPRTIWTPPNSDWDNTSLWSTDLKCKNVEQPVCAWRRGGSFDPNESTTWEEANNTNILETRPEEDRLGISPWGTDTLELEPDTTMEHFPIYSSRVGDLPRNSLGVGRKSQFLKSLVKQGRIASETWSLFWGWQGAEQSHQMNGTLVLGGYDNAKTSDTNFTNDFSDDPDCPGGLLIYLDDIVMDHANGDYTSLLKSPGNAMKSCITTDAPLLTLQKDVYDKFNKSLPGTYVGTSGGLYHAGMSFESKKAYAGNLTFTLSSGLNVTIPNHQLVLPNVALNDNGEQEIVDDKKTILVRDYGAENMPVLGHVFLSAAYLLVDNELEKFTVWQANTTSDVDLVSIDHSDDSLECSGPQGTATSSSDLSGANEDDDEDSDQGESSGLSGGELAGVIAGPIVGVILLALAILFYLRRRKQKAKALEPQQPPLSDTEARIAAEKLKSKALEPFELSPTTPGPAEMDAGRGHEIPLGTPDRPYEMPGNHEFPTSSPLLSPQSPQPAYPVSRGHSPSISEVSQPRSRDPSQSTPR